MKNKCDVGTVEEYQELVIKYPDLDLTKDGELKSYQRIWVYQQVIDQLPSGSAVLDVGGARCYPAAALAELGYEVWVVDPYDGFGNGVEGFEGFKASHPNIKFIRGYLGYENLEIPESYFDGIISVGAIEKCPADKQLPIWNAYKKVLKDGGMAFDAIGFLVRGDEKMIEVSNDVVTELLKHRGFTETGKDLTRNACENIDTFFMSPHAHIRWRKGTKYSEYPYKYVATANISVQILK